MSESFSAVAARQLDLRSRSDARRTRPLWTNSLQTPSRLGVTDTGEVVQVDALSALVHQLIEQGGDVGGEEGEEEGGDDGDEDEEEGEDDDDDDDYDDDDDDDDEQRGHHWEYSVPILAAAYRGRTARSSR